MSLLQISDTKGYLREVRELLNHCEAQLKAVSKIAGTPANAGFQILVHAMVQHCRELLASSMLLFTQGFVRPAMNLWRSIFEASVTLIYVRRDREERVPLLMGHIAVYQKRLRDGMLAHKFLDPKQVSERGPAEASRIEAAFQEVKDDYPRLNNWAGVTIADMAREVGAESLYNFEYRVLCDEVHVGAAALASRFIEAPGRTLVLKDDDQPPIAVPLLYRVIEWMYQVLMVHAAEFDPEKCEHLERKRDEFVARYR